MKIYEYKEINGYIVVKRPNMNVRARNGYATYYFLFENMKDAAAHKSPIGCYRTMAEVKQAAKD